MRNLVAIWTTYALLSAVGAAHATDKAADPAQSTSSPPAERAGKANGNNAGEQPTKQPVVPVDEDMLEYLDILVEMKVLDSMETIETLQAVGEEEDEP